MDPCSDDARAPGQGGTCRGQCDMTRHCPCTNTAAVQAADQVLPSSCRAWAPAQATSPALLTQRTDVVNQQLRRMLRLPPAAPALHCKQHVRCLQGEWCTCESLWVGGSHSDSMIRRRCLVRASSQVEKQGINYDRSNGPIPASASD